MRLYKYTAIITKNTVLQGKTTFTDNRNRPSDCMIHLPLDSECKTGHVLGESPALAQRNVIAEIMRLYPAERGYGGHDNVRVEVVEEIPV